MLAISTPHPFNFSPVTILIVTIENDVDGENFMRESVGVKVTMAEIIGN